MHWLYYISLNYNDTEVRATFFSLLSKWMPYFGKFSNVTLAKNTEKLNISKFVLWLNATSK